MDSTQVSSGTMGVFFSGEQPNGVAYRDAVSQAEAVSHFNGLMSDSKNSSDELSGLLRRIASPSGLAYEDLVRFQSELAAKGIHWNLQEVEQAVLEDRKRRIGNLEEAGNNKSGEEFAGFFEGLAEDMQKVTSENHQISYAKLMRLQAQLAQESIYWNLASKVADKCLSGAQTLMSSQV